MRVAPHERRDLGLGLRVYGQGQREQEALGLAEAEQPLAHGLDVTVALPVVHVQRDLVEPRSDQVTEKALAALRQELQPVREELAGEPPALDLPHEVDDPVVERGLSPDHRDRVQAAPPAGEVELLADRREGLQVALVQRVAEAARQVAPRHPG
jgi:hypothetical protein